MHNTRQISDAEIAEAREVLSYNASTGHLSWSKKTAKKVVVGATAGMTRHDGYRIIQINKKRYLEHRLVFAMHHGWCPLELDHINGNPNDNRIENLRPANRRQQSQNKRIARKNKCGYKGVYLHRKSGLYSARIKVDGKSKCLRYHKTAEDAARAYAVAAQQYFGEFARIA